MPRTHPHQAPRPTTWRSFLLGSRAVAALLVIVAVGPGLVVALRSTSDRDQVAPLALAALIALVLSYAAAELLIVRPLRRMSAVARRVRAGDLGARMGSPGRVSELQELASTLDDMVGTLEARTREAERAPEERAALVAALVSATEHERERIAGHVHDDAIQAMVAIGIRLCMLRSRIDDPEQEAILGELERTLEATIRRARTLLFELRPPALDRAGLRDALEELLGETFGDGTVWTLETRYDSEPVDATRVILYRIAQEALGNARRHAGAGRVEVVVETRDGGITTRIHDDGVGFDPVGIRPAPGHLGLTSMRERALVTGGTFRIESALGDGTTVEWWLP